MTGMAHFYATWDATTSTLRRACRNSGLKGTERSAMLSADMGKRPAPTLPYVAWLDRDHPCPDIDDVIRARNATKQIDEQEKKEPPDRQVIGGSKSTTRGNYA